MKVTNNSPNALQNAVPNSETAKASKLGGAEAALEGKKSRAAAGPGILDSARVDVSTKAQEFQKAKALATPNNNDIDEAKVARLQKLIDEGRYKVDAEAIADRLLNEHTKMP